MAHRDAMSTIVSAFSFLWGGLCELFYDLSLQDGDSDDSLRKVQGVRN